MQDPAAFALEEARHGILDRRAFSVGILECCAVAVPHDEVLSQIHGGLSHPLLESKLRRRLCLSLQAILLVQGAPELLLMQVPHSILLGLPVGFLPCEDILLLSLGFLTSCEGHPALECIEQGSLVFAHEGIAQGRVHSLSISLLHLALLGELRPILENRLFAPFLITGSPLGHGSHDACAGLVHRNFGLGSVLRQLSLVARALGSQDLFQLRLLIQQGFLHPSICSRGFRILLPAHEDSHQDSLGIATSPFGHRHFD
mmetsp:Transcript_31077/g.72907  ORF Transcript_31077/g.72907 Transcript_31077/m.72907 type:complete len:258 (-) Transcript_31077:1806-2579(-)